MDIKELGGCGVLVIGGTIFGVSQMGLNDVLSEDIRHFQSVSADERASYMESVVTDFKNNFETYSIQSGEYVFVGLSEFSTRPPQGLFIEVVTQKNKVPAAELAGIREQLTHDTFCAQDEMMIFTDNGWDYKFTLKDGSGRRIKEIKCMADGTSGSV